MNARIYSARHLEMSAVLNISFFCNINYRYNKVNHMFDCVMFAVFRLHFILQHTIYKTRTQTSNDLYFPM